MRDLSLSAFSLLVCLILGFGCRDQDKIVRYRVPKQKSTSTADTQEMLVAVTERNGEVYFFKTVGPSDRMDQCRDAVKRFVKTIRFPASDNARPSWQLPDGWSERKGSGMRIATLLIDNTDNTSQPLELAVSSLPQTNPNWNAYLTSNLNRWRGQLGLKPVAEKQASDSFDTFSNDGQTIYFAQIKATDQNPVEPPIERAAGLSIRPNASLTGFDRELVRGTPPADWKPGPVTGMRKACFRMRADGQALEVTVIPAGGDLLANVNRWRGQLKLDPINQEQLEQAIVDVKAGNLNGKFVALPGSSETILVAVFPAAGGNSWFVKLRGDREIAEKQTTAFKSFISSLRFAPTFQ